MKNLDDFFLLCVYMLLYTCVLIESVNIKKDKVSFDKKLKSITVVNKLFANIVGFFYYYYFTM